MVRKSNSEEIRKLINLAHARSQEEGSAAGQNMAAYAPKKNAERQLDLFKKCEEKHVRVIHRDTLEKFGLAEADKLLELFTESGLELDDIECAVKYKATTYKNLGEFVSVVKQDRIKHGNPSTTRALQGAGELSITLTAGQFKKLKHHHTKEDPSTDLPPR